jgi:sugar phosphate isomerase/epimerase
MVRKSLPRSWIVGVGTGIPLDVIHFVPQNVFARIAKMQGRFGMSARRNDGHRKHGIHGKVPFAFHRTPGFGDTNRTDVMSELRLGGYQGSIDIECWHDPVYSDELEMTGQVRALNYPKECRGGAFVANP